MRAWARRRWSGTISSSSEKREAIGAFTGKMFAFHTSQTVRSLGAFDLIPTGNETGREHVGEPQVDSPRWRCIVGDVRARRNGPARCTCRWAIRVRISTRG